MFSAALYDARAEVDFTRGYIPGAGSAGDGASRLATAPALSLSSTSSRSPDSSGQHPHYAGAEQ
eukprot:8580486-Lingulodinium_polyedra.AAC.1